MQKEFEKLHEKLDKVVEKIGTIEISQAKTEVIMDEHIRRTALNEENIDILRQEFRPVKSHVQFINNISKFIAIIASILVFLESLGILQKLLGFLF